jgi:hypothetical protein
MALVLLVLPFFPASGVLLTVGFVIAERYMYNYLINTAMGIWWIFDPLMIGYSTCQVWGSVCWWLLG